MMFDNQRVVTFYFFNLADQLPLPPLFIIIIIFFY